MTSVAHAVNTPAKNTPMENTPTKIGKKTNSKKDSTLKEPGTESKRRKNGLFQLQQSGYTNLLMHF